MQSQAELERSAVIGIFQSRIRDAVHHLHSDVESLHLRMDAVVIGSDPLLLFFRKELHEIAHVHECHVKLVWSL